MQETAGDATSEEYTERLYVPWFHWLLPLVAAGLLAAEIDMGYSGFARWLPYLVLLAIAVLAMSWLSSMQVAVRDGELWVAGAHIPLDALGEIEVVPPAERRRALGPELDPAALVRQRSWVKPLLRVEIRDPKDPTPYWVFSTRHPEQMVAAIRAGQRRQRGDARPGRDTPADPDTDR